MAAPRFEQRLGFPTAMLLVVASMVGTGVFTTSGFLLRDLDSAWAVLTTWLVGGIVAIAGALAYAELVASLPHNGGEYQLLSRIYHPSVGFVSGFTSLVVGFSAPTAASAIAFGEYLDLALGGGVAPPPVSAVALVLAAAIVHSVRVEVGRRFQNAFTAGKIALMALFIVAGILAGDLARVGDHAARPFLDAARSPAFAVGLVFVTFSYSGWNAAAYVAGEVRDPTRNVPLALLVGTGLVTLLYLGLNAVFLASAPAGELIAAEERVGAIAAIALFGLPAGRALAGAIALGLVSTVGALVMTGPRVYEAIGLDYPRIRILARRRDGGGPAVAIALQSAVTIVMMVSASFETLLTYIGFTLSLFAALTVIGVFVLRVREPTLARPYRTWGYPATPLVFIALSGWMTSFAILERPMVALTGFATLALGAALYIALSRA